MALTRKSSSRWWLRLHLLTRLLGLTALLIAGAGLALAVAEEVLTLELVWAWTRGELTGTPAWALGLLLVGGLLAIGWLLVELLIVLLVVAGRRSAFGFNAVVQTLLAAVLLVGVNSYFFASYPGETRSDWTRDQRFTLPAAMRQQLGQLRGATTIVVYVNHMSFGRSYDQRHVYFDFAAERKVIEKVQDLVDQFREFGPQFQVEVLDVQEEDYQDKLERLTRDRPELAEAIAAAPENSIFFAADGRVQRLNFRDFYLLDKAASRGADGGEENLVLLYQGVEPFARKVLNIDEKQPKVGVLVIHEVLSTRGDENFGLAGMRNTLTRQGFEVEDVILKRESEEARRLEPAVFTFEESRHERLAEQIELLEADRKILRSDIERLSELESLWAKSSLSELEKQYADQLKGNRLTEAFRQQQLILLRANLLIRQAQREQVEQELATAIQEKQGLSVERLDELRRIKDLRAKLERKLADYDLLIIPRLTIWNLYEGGVIDPEIHHLDDAQYAAIREFVISGQRAGKPILALWGPINDPRGGPTPPDALEQMLQDLGIRLGRQTVLHNVESKAFAERRSGLFTSGTDVNLPPVQFRWKPGELQYPNRPLAQKAAELPPNPIRQAMAITERSLDRSLDLKIPHPRPIYYDPDDKDSNMPFQAEFMLTDAASWNEPRPFPTRERAPRFEPRPDDPHKGTLDEVRRGPFPIGVAVDALVPVSWYATRGSGPKQVRVAVIGQGNVFIGKELSPAHQELLLNTCNWLLGRDDLMARDDHVWRYPRVSLADTERKLWQWGTVIGLPAMFAYFGIVVLFWRRFR